MESEVIFNMLINRRPRIYRQRRNFFTYYEDVDFRFRYRMSKEAAWMILELIRHKIQHKTMRNKAITPEGLFLLTLRYFATGCLQRFDGVSVSTTSRTIRRVCCHIAMLSNRFIKFPSAIDDIQKLQKEFYQLAKFPRVLAAIDCTHVKITSPGGEKFFERGSILLKQFNQLRDELTYLTSNNQKHSGM